MKVKVESQSDAKGQESPTRFTLGTRIIEVEACVDRWHGEQACYYRVLGSDENSYILKGPLEDGSWGLVSFTHKDSRGTAWEYEDKRELQQPAFHLSRSVRFHRIPLNGESPLTIIVEVTLCRNNT